MSLLTIVAGFTGIWLTVVLVVSVIRGRLEFDVSSEYFMDDVAGLCWLLAVVASLWFIVWRSVSVMVNHRRVMCKDSSFVKIVLVYFASLGIGIPLSLGVSTYLWSYSLIGYLHRADAAEITVNLVIFLLYGVFVWRAYNLVISPPIDDDPQRISPKRSILPVIGYAIVLVWILPVAMMWFLVTLPMTTPGDHESVTQLSDQPALLLNLAPIGVVFLMFAWRALQALLRVTPRNELAPVEQPAEAT